MADPDRDESSLELPSFRLRGKRRKKKARSSPESTVAAQPEPTPEPEPVAEPEPEPVAEPEPVPEAEPAPGPDTAPTSTLDGDHPTTVAEPEPVSRDAAAEWPLFADEAPAAATTVAPAVDREEPERARDRRKRRKQEQKEQKRERKAQKKARRSRRRLRLGAVAAGILTGLLVGLATVGLTWGSLELCELIRGASSCGGTGVLVLLLILVAMIFLGTGLLRMFGVADAFSTSFLAIGLLAVVTLILVDLLFNWWMIIVIPCVTLLTFALSAWVTTSFVDSGPD
jgi:hypothetical protein